MTSAPCAASSLAVAAPIPRPAPVPIAIFPSSSFISHLSLAPSGNRDRGTFWVNREPGKMCRCLVLGSRFPVLVAERADLHQERQAAVELELAGHKRHLAVELATHHGSVVVSIHMQRHRRLRLAAKHSRALPDAAI